MPTVLNHRLGANFDLNLFIHQRIEVWLNSLEKQEVDVPALVLDVRFKNGQGMRTDISAMFGPDM